MPLDYCVNELISNLNEARRRPRPMMRSFASSYILGATLLLLSACSLSPIKEVSSLSPALGADTLDYNDAIGAASDRILLSNILHSRDLEPLNLSQLSSISGSLSLQGTLGFSLPWGAGLSGAASGVSFGGTQYPQTLETPPLVGQKTASPSITASTTPTFTVSPLNTQAFTLSILQPISSSYVLNRWQAGIPRELLLLLFVKEIDFPVVASAKTPPRVVSTSRYINDPDSPERFAAFRLLVQTLLNAGAELKSVDALDPVGPPFTLYATVNVNPPTTTPPVSPSTSPAFTIPQGTVFSDLTTNADSTGFGLITASNDAQYHVGNATAPSYFTSQPTAPDDPSDPNNPANLDGSGNPKIVPTAGQLYRVYAGQVELTVDDTWINKASCDLKQEAELALEKPPTGLAITDPDLFQTKLDLVSALKLADGKEAVGAVVTGPHIQTVTPGVIPTPGPAAQGGAGGTQGGGAGGGGAARSGSGSPTPAVSSSQALTAALQAGRVSALVKSSDLEGDEVVLDRLTEAGFQRESRMFIHIQWRSVSEVFDYLGAILRYNQRHPSDAFTFAADNDASVRTANSQSTDPDPSPTGKKLVFFDVINYKTPVPLPFEPSLTIKYKGNIYGVRDATSSPRIDDYSKVILSMLSTLVNYSAQPSVSTSTPLRLLPIP